MSEAVPVAGDVASSGDPPRHPPSRALPRGLLILLGLAAATVAVGGMKALSGLIAPTFMGIVLVLTVQDTNMANAVHDGGSLKAMPEIVRTGCR